MLLTKYKESIPEKIYDKIISFGIKELRPSQIKSMKKGLFKGNNLLVCTPTASGKTLVAEIAMLNILNNRTNPKTKAIYVVPLKALANEKFKQFSKRYPEYKVAITSGDMDSQDLYLENYDIIITTSEKLDSLSRHNSPWLNQIKILIIDEIHLLNDFGRGPTLEIIITLLRKEIKDLQLIGLSATIGNAKELAGWLNAELVEDDWRPVRLDKGVAYENKIYFKE
jgi:helicase